MRFDIPLVDEHRMLLDLVERFVADELMPLEPAVLAREASGAGRASPPSSSIATPPVSGSSAASQ